MNRTPWLLLIAALGCDCTPRDPPPIAVLTPAALTVPVGQLVRLDGSESHDASGAPLEFQFRFRTTPSDAELTVTQSEARFTPDLVGTWEVELVVTAGSRVSEPARSVITVVPAVMLPVANASGDRTSRTNESIRLDGRQSFDPLGQPLTFEWSVNAAGARLLDTETERPSFSAPTLGVYEVTLVVTAGGRRSAPDTVIITVTHENRPPVAIADQLFVAEPGQPISLDGTQSFDPDGDPLTFSWSVMDAAWPVGIADAEAARTSFVATKAGWYRFQLLVKDPYQGAAFDHVELMVAVLPVGAIDGGSGPGDGGALFDPNEVYFFGSVNEPLCQGGLAHWSNPGSVTTGFTCDFRAQFAKIRPTDGRLLYRNAREHVVREYHCDTCSYSGVYPVGDVLQNDVVLRNECSGAPGDGVEDFVVTADAAVLHTCVGAPRIWRDVDGVPVYDGRTDALVAAGQGGWLLTRSRVVNTITGLTRPISWSLPGDEQSRWWITARWNGTGFWIAFTPSSGEEPQLWQVDTNGAGQLVGIYPGAFTGRVSNRGGALDSAGRLFRTGDDGWGYTGALFRSELGGVTEMVYSEANGPVLRLDDGFLLTGP